MNFINFCSCGKQIDEDFIYCPWCGTRLKEADDKEVLENVFKQLEIKQSNDRLSRVKKIETKIAEIEKVLREISENTIQKE